MTTIEEQIWDYIDGSCTAEEKLTIKTKIASDKAYSIIYRELLAVNKQLADIDLDEPSMAFNRRVMNLVEMETAPVSLKTRVDHRIIYGIAAFFILAIVSIVIYSISQIQFSASATKLEWPSVNFDFNRYLTPTFIRIFLFVDLLLGFIYLDGFLRRKKVS